MLRITKGQINKLCGRRGVSRSKIEAFFSELPETQELALEKLTKITANKSTVGAIKSGITISYKEDQVPCLKN